MPRQQQRTATPWPPHPEAEGCGRRINHLSLRKVDCHMKLYLGGPMFDIPNVRYNIALAGRIRSLGYDVYCPNENASINDKTRTDITPENVYSADMNALLASNIFLCQVSEDSGTMWEAGYMDCLSRNVDPTKYLGVIGLATDIRLHTVPDPAKTGVDNQAWAINALIIGGLKTSLGVYLSEDTLLHRLSHIIQTS